MASLIILKEYITKDGVLILNLDHVAYCLEDIGPFPCVEVFLARPNPADEEYPPDADFLLERKNALDFRMQVREIAGKLARPTSEEKQK
jgi:hypothetical protein